MKHYGDITKLSGHDLPVVDVITGGSPCQDLSVAGKRAGLAGERSGLFMEQMRIVKEMRELDRNAGRAAWAVRPRYMVWENVPGAFSSGSPKGADFAAVIEEIIKVAEPGASVHVCVPDRGWTKSGCYYAEDGSWSIAWRVHDAQFWGVPQRRKRIALVADFGGLSAPEILFERKGLSGDIEPCGEERETTPGATGNDTKSASGVVSKGNGEAFLMREKTSSLAVGGGMPGQGYPCVMETAGAIGGGVEGASGVVSYGFDQSAARDVGALFLKECAKTITNGTAPGHHNGVLVEGASETISFQERAGKPGGGKGILIQREHVGALSTLNNQSVLQSAEPTVYGISAYESNAMKSSNPHSGVYEADTARTLDLNGGSPACNQGGMAVVQSAVYDARGNGDSEVVPTITGDHQNRVTDYTAIVTSSGTDVAGTLDANYYKGCGERQGVEREVVVSTYQDVTGALTPGAHPGSYNGQDAYNDMLVTGCYQNTGQGWWNESDVGATIRTPCGGDSVKANLVTTAASIVRRLTPLECERLQGYPDGWTDIGEWTDSKGKRHKEADSPRYKALGNSIALPFWQWLARRICAQYERDVTMASLFDGIGGFPLVFERCGAKAVWASEIEEFPIAVTKKHFQEVED